MVTRALTEAYLAYAGQTRILTIEPSLELGLGKSSA
jgi:hypothetical protein